MLNFLIIGFQRTGTTAVLRALAAAPDVAVIPYEISLTWFFGASSAFRTRQDVSSLQSKCSQAAIESALDTPSPIRGAKSALGSVEELSETIAQIREWCPGIRIIATVRKDLIAQAASRMWAGMTGQWQSWESPVKDDRLNAGDPNSIEISPSYLRYLKIQQIRYMELLREFPQNHVYVLDFDRFFSVDSREELENIFRFVGSEGSDVEIDWGKNSPPYATFVKNLSELKPIQSRLDQCNSLADVMEIKFRPDRMGSLRRRARHVLEGLLLPSRMWEQK